MRFCSFKLLHVIILTDESTDTGNTFGCVPVLLDAVNSMFGYTNQAHYELYDIRFSYFCLATTPQSRVQHDGQQHHKQNQPGQDIVDPLPHFSASTPSRHAANELTLPSPRAASCSQLSGPQVSFGFGSLPPFTTSLHTTRGRSRVSTRTPTCPINWPRNSKLRQVLGNESGFFREVISAD